MCGSRADLILWALVADLLGSLGKQLVTEVDQLLPLDAYYRGKQPLSFLHPQISAELGSRLRNLSINSCRVAIGAVEERLDVVGYRLGKDQPADDSLWAIWQANDLDEMSQLAHTEAMAMKRAYVTVWADDGGTPTIRVESPLQMICSYEPGSRVVNAALKSWRDDDRLYATLYEPDQITRLRSRVKVQRLARPDWRPEAWEIREVIPNPMGRVPVVPIVNRPRLIDMDGESEMADIIPLVDAVNKLATDMMVSAEYHAMPRRWATNMEVPVDPTTGQPLTAFEQLAGRVWLNPAEGGTFGQFPEAQLSNFIEAIRLLTGQICAIAGLPPHYMGLSGDNPASADAIRSSEAALVKKAKRKQRQWGGSWEEVMRLAHLAQTGSELPGGDMLETIWADPETPTTAQTSDAALKRKEIGVPWQQLMEDLRYSPVQIERMKEWRRQDAAQAALAVADPFGIAANPPQPQPVPAA